MLEDWLAICPGLLFARLRKPRTVSLQPDLSSGETGGLQSTRGVSSRAPNEIVKAVDCPHRMPPRIGAGRLHCPIFIRPTGTLSVPFLPPAAPRIHVAANSTLKRSWSVPAAVYQDRQPKGSQRRPCRK